MTRTTIARAARTAAAALALALALTAWGCAADDWGPAALAEGKTSARIAHLEQGRDVYATYCAGCHGERGDGNGPAARFFRPKPRDFTLGRLKFAAVSSGQAPRDDDYARVIDHGLMGTAMPAFPLLPGDEQRAVIAYIKSFYADWAEDPPGAAIDVGADPWTDDPAGGVAEGERVYHSVAKCWSCHPAYVDRTRIRALHDQPGQTPPSSFRDGLYDSLVTDSQWGEQIEAPDFLVDRVKTGLAIDDLVRVISAGVGGTAMPTWAGALPPEQLWGLAYYVRSIAALRGTPAGGALRDRLDTYAAQ